MASNDPQAEFVPTMLAFLEWYLRLLGPQFAQELMRRTGCATIEDAARRLLKSITDSVRGNRGDDAVPTAADYGAVMDRIAAIHLRTRHGADAVSLSAVPEFEEE